MLRTGSQAMPRFLERRVGPASRSPSKITIQFLFSIAPRSMVRTIEIQGITSCLPATSPPCAKMKHASPTVRNLRKASTSSLLKAIFLRESRSRSNACYDSKKNSSPRLSRIFPERGDRKSTKDEVVVRPLSKVVKSPNSQGWNFDHCLNTRQPSAIRKARPFVTRLSDGHTHRREIERRLHQQQEFAGRLIDSFPDLILVLNTSARYTFVVPLQEILGYETQRNSGWILATALIPRI